MAKVLTFEETRELMKQVIAESPDKEETKAYCQYVSDEVTERYDGIPLGEPVCAVGRLFVNKLGIEPSVFLNGLNGTGISQVMNPRNALVEKVQPILDTVEFTPKALDYLVVFQDEQDSSHTWGMADSEAAASVADTREDGFDA